MLKKANEDLFETELIKIDDETEISVNVEQFYIMLTNILNNAIKYSNSEGSISVEASSYGVKTAYTLEEGENLIDKDIPY